MDAINLKQLIFIILSWATHVRGYFYKNNPPM